MSEGENASWEGGAPDAHWSVRRPKPNSSLVDLIAPARTRMRRS